MNLQELTQQNQQRIERDQLLFLLQQIAQAASWPENAEVYVNNPQKIVEIGNLAPILEALGNLRTTEVKVSNPVEEVRVSNFVDLDNGMSALAISMQSIKEAVEALHFELPETQEVSGQVVVDMSKAETKLDELKESLSGISEGIVSLASAIGAINVSPEVTVSPTPVTVSEPNLSPITDAITELKESLKTEEVAESKMLGIEMVKTKDGILREIITTYTDHTETISGFYFGNKLTVKYE